MAGTGKSACTLSHADVDCHAGCAHTPEAFSAQEDAEQLHGWGAGGREGSAAAPGGQAQAQAGSKRKASVKERARAKKLSRKAEREGGSDDERLQDGSAFTADFADPRFKVGSLLLPFLTWSLHVWTCHLAPYPTHFGPPASGSEGALAAPPCRRLLTVTRLTDVARTL